MLRCSKASVSLLSVERRFCDCLRDEEDASVRGGAKCKCQDRLASGRSADTSDYDSGDYRLPLESQ